MIKNIHEKLLTTIQTLLINKKIDMPYYGEFNLYINFVERDNIGTCGVNVTKSGMNFIYSPTFLSELTQNAVNFVTLHEDFHLLFDHPKRTITGQYDHKLSNIVQDMIINHILVSDIPQSFIEIPKDSNGKNMALFVPNDYHGKLIFEELYEWMKDEKNKWNDNNSNTNNCLNDEESYGKYGKNPLDNKNPLETWSKERIFQDLDNNYGEYMDKHFDDDVPEEMRDSIVSDIMQNLSSRGFNTGNIESTLDKLRKKRKDYSKELKRSISNMIFGTVKLKTISRPNRRQIPGVKGNKKVKTCINVILDTSGSMSGLVDKVLNYIYKNDVVVNLIEADTQVKMVRQINDTRKLKKIPIKGLGGTCLNPAILYVKENFNKLNTVILTDGYTDSLDFTGINGKVLILSVGNRCPILRSNGKVKQIIVEEN